MSGQNATFPKRTGANKTGKTGVDQVAAIVNNKFEWIFRQNHQEDDFGIDGYIDVVLEDGSVTGQSIAVQIKTGMSFLEQKTPVGYIFAGEDKHLNFYLNHQLPIVVIICDPNTLDCYWESFSPDKTEKAGSNWKMVVPFSKKLTKAAKGELLALVGPVEDYKNALEKHWAFTKALQTADRIMLAIPPEQVKTLDSTFLISFFERILANPTTCARAQGRILLTISGYNQDPRELWEIPEVRAWIQKSVPEIPYWFFFLAPDEGVANSLRLILTCLSEAKLIDIKDGVRNIELEIDLEALQPFIRNNFAGLNEQTKRLDIDEKNDEIGMAALKALGLLPLFDSLKSTPTIPPQDSK